MKKIILGFVTVAVLLSCQQHSYERFENGIVVAIQDTLVRKVKLEALDADIIHVQSAPEIKDKESLVVLPEKKKSVQWSVIEDDENVSLKTEKLIAKVNKANGHVSFTDVEGNIILNEVENGGKSFVTNEVEGESKYEIQQVFDSPSDEAFYGLGQHQHGQMNYKGQDVELAQHNLVAVVPFLYSSKNYGILWDNYSITRFGDPRAYRQINEDLKLFDKNGKEGGLSATYSHDNSWKVTEQVENQIDYQNLDVNGNMPEFLADKSKVVWEGSISTETPGIHKFLLYASEYFTLWVNDELIMDKWRQGWNPWSNKFTLDMKKGVQYKIRLEWKAVEGAYISLKHLNPYPEEKQQQLSLYSEVADQIDYYFIKGENADDVISGYRQITGKASIMPKWAMGLWQSRERYHTQDQLLGVVKEYRKRGIPFDNIVLDWRYWEDPKWGTHEFDSLRFPDPKAMVDELHNELNTQIMISIWPKFNTGTDHFREMEEGGFLFKRLLTKNLVDWVGYYSTFYDPFNPGARDLFWKQIDEHLYNKGFDAWWLDATEPDMHSNFSVEERKLLMSPTYLGSGAEYFNAFSLMNTKGVYEGQIAENPNTRPFILTRSAFAGQQRYAAATWSGDVVTRWSDLKDQIAAGVNFSLSGIPYWTTDIGGFSVEKRYENQEYKHLAEWREINMRWYQFGVFCPLFRIHGQFPLREIYNISPEGHPVYDAMVYYDKLRYRLMPYIYSLAGMAYHNDYTIMRGLIMDYAEDIKITDIADQYMFGPSLLINPVYEFKATSRTVYLPKSNGWYNLYTGEYLDGGQQIEANAPLTSIPVYVPAGAIIPVGPEIQYAMEKKTDPLTLYIYAGSDGSFELYEDNGLNNQYQKNAYTFIPFKYNNQNKSLVIGKIKGEYPEMLKERTIHIIFVNKDNAFGIDNTDAVTKTVTYNGNEQTIMF